MTHLEKGQVVVLRANPEEDWPEERVRILESGDFGPNECIVVGASTSSSALAGVEGFPVEDGLLEITVDQIKEE